MQAPAQSRSGAPAGDRHQHSLTKHSVSFSPVVIDRSTGPAGCSRGTVTSSSSPDTSLSCECQDRLAFIMAESKTSAGRWATSASRGLLWLPWLDVIVEWREFVGAIESCSSECAMLFIEAKEMVVKLANNELPWAKSCPSSSVPMRLSRTGEFGPRDLLSGGVGGRGRFGGGPGQGGRRFLASSIVGVI